MQTAQQKLRPNVAICVVNPNQEVLLVWSREQRPNDWKLPQGGIEPGETLAQAARRELKEEVGLTNVRLLKLRPEVYRYYWPAKLLKRKDGYAKDGYVGQVQSLAIVAVPVTRPKLTPDPREATRVKWVPIAKFMASLSPVRRGIGKFAFVELTKLFRLPPKRGARASVL
jgi:putative (di)nucleoside polyphosphate hydrolase